MRRRQGSTAVWMGGHDRVLQLLGALAPYQPVLDYVLAPPQEMLPFLLEHTSEAAVRKLPRAVIRLLDDFVHDSRAWFGFHTWVGLRSTTVTCARPDLPSRSPRRVASCNPAIPPPTITMRVGDAMNKSSRDE